MSTETITPRWNDGRIVIVAAPGPSLTEEVAERCRKLTVLAIKEAYRRLPWAEVMYGCDEKFWRRRDGCRDFKGEKWASHGTTSGIDDKIKAKTEFGLKLVKGKSGKGFSFADNTIHYGCNSGFQGINLTLLFGATRVVLVGFDMQGEGAKRYFFGGPHSTQTSSTAYGMSIPHFHDAARALPKHISITNCTPGSAMKCFPMADLHEYLSHTP